MTNTLPSTREHAKKFDILAKKSLGQNFLFDNNLNDKIARSAGAIEGKIILEIGPGPAGLTKAILNYNPKKLFVIEKDQRCIALLNEIKEFYPQLEIIAGDALTYKIKDLLTASVNNQPLKIIANLPYNIGCPLLFNWLKEIDYIEDLTLMFQKEVADRICAIHGNKTYGRLSIMVQLHASIKKLFDIPPTAFTPSPKVYSSLIKVTPKNIDFSPEFLTKFDIVVSKAFNQRRKMLSSALKEIIPDKNFYETVNIEPSKRPEDLSLADYIKLVSSLVH